MCYRRYIYATPKIKLLDIASKKKGKEMKKMISKSPIVFCMLLFSGSGTPRPKTISARDSSARTFRPIFQSGTARPTLVGLLGPFFFYFLFIIFFGGGGNLLLYSVYVHQNKIQETLFNVILIFRQGNRGII